MATGKYGHDRSGVQILKKAKVWSTFNIAIKRAKNHCFLRPKNKKIFFIPNNPLYCIIRNEKVIKL